MTTAAPDTVYYTWYIPRCATPPLGDPSLTPCSAAQWARWATEWAHREGIPAGYVWFREGFCLWPAAAPPSEHWWLVQGHAHYGDALGDEGLVAWLLARLTQQVRGSVARCYDSDGEFLLWDAMERQSGGRDGEEEALRAVLWDGKVVAMLASEVEVLLSSAADRTDTVSTRLMTRALRTRPVIRVLEAPSDEWRHRARFDLPITVVACLRRAPWLLPRFVNAFCDQPNASAVDSDCSRLDAEGARQPVVLTLSRVLYARLWFCAQAMRFEQEERLSADALARCLGTAVAAGAARYLQQLQACAHDEDGSEKDAGVGAELSCLDMDRVAPAVDPVWRYEQEMASRRRALADYRRQLARRGYFQGIEPHSAEWQQAEAALRSEWQSRYRSADAPARGWLRLARETLARALATDVAEDDAERMEASAPPDQVVDDDSWLTGAAAAPEENDGSVDAESPLLTYAAMDEDEDAGEEESGGETQQWVQRVLQRLGLQDEDDLLATPCSSEESSSSSILHVECPDGTEDVLVAAEAWDAARAAASDAPLRPSPR